MLRSQLVFVEEETNEPDLLTHIQGEHERIDGT